MGGFMAVFLVFLVLKLTGVIAWSWLYVTMPLWIVPAGIVAFIGIFLVVVLPFVIITAILD